MIRRALVGADVAGLLVAFIASELVYPIEMDRAGVLSQFAEVAVFGLALPCWIVAAKLYGLYDKDEERTDHSTADDFAGVFHLLTVTTWLLYAVSLMTDWFNPQFGKLFLFWAAAVVGVPVARAAARAACRRQVHYLQNTIIVGAGSVGQTIAKKLLKHPEYGINLVGFVDANPRERMGGLDHLTILGDGDSLPQLVSLLDVERVIYAFSSEAHNESVEMIRRLNELNVQVDIVPRFYEVLSPAADIHSVEGLPMLGLPPTRLSSSDRVVKRAVDLVGAIIGLVVFAPLFVLLILAIRLDSRGPAFFRQVRMGARDSTFKIWKFRTMVADADKQKHEFAHLNKHLSPGGDPRMFKIDDDPRMTRLGGLLRRYSIDEFPQLFNVVRGQMSLVGPRPLILDEHAHVLNWGQRRLDLKPGMTGLWQVLGRDEIGFEEMVRLDYVYVTGWSLLGDLKLIFRTLPAPLAVRAPANGAKTEHN